MKHPVDIHVGKRIRHRRWMIGMTQQQLHGAQVLGSPVDQRYLGSAHGVRPVIGWVQSKLLYPALKDPGVLARPKMRRVMHTTGEDEVVGLEPRLFDPLLNRVACHRCDLELDGAVSFMLQMMSNLMKHGKRGEKPH